MINVEKLTEHIQDKLNTVAGEMRASFEFRVFTDAGARVSTEYDQYDERSDEDLRAVVWGTAKTETSRLLPAKGLKVETVTQTVMLGVECQNKEPSADGTFPELQKVRVVVDAFINQFNGETFETFVDDERYTVTTNYSPATVGQRDYVSGTTGVLIPLYFSSFHTAVGGGISANDVTVKIDGKEVFSQQIVFTRTRLANQYATETGNAETAILQSGFGVDLTVPLLSENAAYFLPLVMEDDGNNAHLVEVEYSNELRYAYVCVSGQGSTTLLAGSNVGLSLSFAQGVQNVMDYGSGWDDAEAILGTEGSLYKLVMTTNKFPNTWYFFPGGVSVYCENPNAPLFATYEEEPTSRTVRWRYG